jgi:hypothetical protein
VLELDVAVADFLSFICLENKVGEEEGGGARGVVDVAKGSACTVSYMG